MPVTWRKQHTDRGPAEIELISLPVPYYFDTQRLRCADHVLESAAWRKKANPQFLWPKIFQHCDHPAYVIGMSMGDRHGIEMRDAARPKVGRDDVFAEIELRSTGANGPASVNQERA